MGHLHRTRALTPLRVSLLAFLQVTLVTVNVIHVAAGHVWLSAAGSAAIQLVWWNNTSAARPQGALPACCYALGGVCGVLVVMTLTQ